MNAAIITIGDEILIGQTTDTNSAYIAKTLEKIGIQTVEMCSIGDQRGHILDTLRKYQGEVSVVIMTGGLGPTRDDITKKTLCEYFGDKFVFDENVLAHVTRLVEGYFKRPITQLNKDQALVPSKAVVLHNEYGTAPGMWLEKGGTVFISLPGVPYEMKALMDREVVPRLMKAFSRPFILHKNVLTYGVGESLLAERIEPWENNLPEQIRLAYLPSPGKVKLRLTARGKDQEELEDLLDAQIDALTEIISDCIVGYDEDETIEVAVGRILMAKQLTLSAAESCTGGRIASMITAHAGCSAFFKGSAVTYATDSKVDILRVDKTVIERYSVVSGEVAIAMAQGARKVFASDYAVSTTGNAGPTKGDSDVEMGTVFIAVAGPKGTICEEFQFGQPREKVLERAAAKALEMVRSEILKNVE